MGAEVTAETLMCFCFLVAAGVTAAWLGVRKALPPLVGTTMGVRVQLGAAILGLSLAALYGQWGWKLAAPRATPALLLAGPALLALGGVAFLKERPRPLQAAGLVALLAGLAVCSRESLDTGLGTVFLLIAAVAWAGYALAQKRLAVTFGAQGSLLYVYAGAALLSLPFARLDGFDPVWAGVGAVATAVGCGVFAAALARWDTLRVGAVAALLPAVAHAWTAEAWGGGALVAAGTGLIALGGRRNGGRA